MQSQQQKSNPMTVALLVLVLVFGSLGLWYPKVKERLDVAEIQCASVREDLAKRKRDIQKIDDLYAAYETARATVPTFPEGSAVDTYWLPMMDNAAKENNVKIAQRSIKGEETIGDITELTIECRDWEGRLDSLVNFLYTIEQQDPHTVTMMNFRKLSMKPSAKNPGILQGTFELNCAYMREPAVE